MVQRKTAVTPLLMHWSYCSLMLSHGNVLQLHRFMLALCVWYGPTPDHCRQKVCCCYNT